MNRTNIDKENDNAKISAPVRLALAGLSLSILMSSLDTSIANAALPTLAQAFNGSFQQVQWVVLSYLLAVTTLIVSVGRLGDIISRRRLLLIGIGVFTAASLLCGIAPDLWSLIAARVIQGLGAAVMMALSVAMVGETVAKAKTGSAIGLLGTMSAIGTTLGPSLGGILMTGFGWRSIFLVNLPLGILDFLLVYRYMPKDRKEVKAHHRSAGFDKIGTVLLAAALAAYALAMTAGHGSFGLINVALSAGAIIGLGSFLFVERRAVSPLVSVTMFRDPSLGLGLAMSSLVSAVVMATLVVGPFYLSLGLGLETGYVGFAISAGPLAAALAGIPAGHAVDRFGKASMTIAGLGGMALGSLLLSIIPTEFGLIGYIVPILVITSSYALFQAANNTRIMAGAGAENRGVISGMLSLSRNLGLITGASVMGAVFSLAAGTADVAAAGAESVAHGMRVTFACATGLVVIALAAAVASQKRPVFAEALNG